MQEYSQAPSGPTTKVMTFKEVERQHMLDVLTLTNWNYTHAMKLLGCSRATMYRKTKEHDLNRPDRQF